MKDNIKVAIYFVACVIFMILAYVGYNILSERELDSSLQDIQNTNSKKEENIKMPKFELYLENGEKISSEELLTGKPLVINIWTTWCAYCDIEMEYFNKMYLKEKDNITFVMINATGDRDSKENAKKYIENKGYKFNVYYDLKLNAISNLGIYSYPTTIFVNKEGYIDNVHVGVISEEMLKNKIENLK